MNRYANFKTSGILLTLVVMLAGLVTLPSAALAQDDLGGTYVSESGTFGFNYPENWFVLTEEDGFVGLSNTEAVLETATPGPEDVLFVFVEPSLFVTLVPDATSPVTALEGFLALAEMTGEITEITLDDRAGARADVETPDGPLMAVVIEFSDGTFGLVAVSTGGDLADFKEIALAVIATFDLPAQAGSTGVPCTVQTDKANYAAVHVGPGYNRTELNALKPGQAYTVLGEAEASDGTQWWKLDVNEASPGSGAAESWVDKAKVTAAGDCDAVGEAAAPPIIPIVPVAPPSPTAPAASGQPAQPPVVPSTGLKGKGVFVMFPEWNNQLPANMRATSAQSAMYIVSITPNLVTVAEETYVKANGERTTVRRIRIEYVASLINAANGAELARQTFVGSEPPPFPNTMSISGTLNGNPPSFNDFLAWLRGVTGL